MWIRPSEITMEGYYWFLLCYPDTKSRTSIQIVRFQRLSSDLPENMLPFDIVFMDEFDETNSIKLAKYLDNGEETGKVWHERLKEPDLSDELLKFNPPDSIEW
jgi:hypothetical protein